MVRIGGFLKTQNRIRRHQARGRFISPYEIGGTIFGKSTMARYPLMHIIAPPLYDDEEFDATPKDERWDLLWEVTANALSVDVPVCLPRKRQVVDDHGPTPKRYKKEMPLNTFTIIVDLGQTKNHVAQFV